MAAKLRASTTVTTFLLLEVELRLTSGLLSAVSMAKPGPKPVSDLTLVEKGSGRLH